MALQLFVPAAALLSILNPVYAVDNGVAKLPVLGYNTWNAYRCDIDQDLILEIAELMKDLGLQDAGYNYVNIDDCYAVKNRTENGDIVEDPVRFSGGMRNLTDAVHALGYKTGIYSDSGWFTCGGYPGSFENEERDARLFRQEWGFDYLKYDNCAIPFDSITQTGIVGRYQRMKDALDSLAEEDGQDPTVFSLCEWGWSQVWMWGKYMGHSWRTTGDISPAWDSLAAIINFNSFLMASTDFGARNDLDMLQLGNGNMTYEEQKSHFTAWALMKSPLLIGTDLSAIAEDTLSILKNREILAINQDSVYGIGISPFRWGINPDYVSNATHPAQYWSGPSENGTVIMVLNTLNEPLSLSFNLTESPWIKAGTLYNVHDLWSETEDFVALRNVTFEDVPPHGVKALLLTDAGNEPDDPTLPLCSVFYQCTDINGTRLDGY